MSREQSWAAVCAVIYMFERRKNRLPGEAAMIELARIRVETPLVFEWSRPRW